MKTKLLAALAALAAIAVSLPAFAQEKPATEKTPNAPALTVEQKLAIRDAQVNLSSIKDTIEALKSRQSEAESALGQVVAKITADLKCSGCRITQNDRNELVLLVPPAEKAEVKPAAKNAEHP